MNTKIQQMVTAILLLGVTLGGLSVSGLLQSTERISTSGIIVVTEPPPIIIPPILPPTPPPPEPEIEIDVYSEIECINSISDLEWGIIEAGSQSQITVYIKNNGETSVALSLTSNNWIPQNAENYMTLDWDYSGQAITPGQVLAITLSLTIDQNCPAMPNFAFEVVITAS